MRSNRLLCCLLAVILFFAVPASAETVYLPTSHDTRPAPEKAEFEPVDLSGYTLLYETGSMRYWWREDRDVLAVENLESGYVIRTGADLPFSGDAKDLVKQMKKDGASTEEILAKYMPYADDLNTTYVGIANSLITIEYIDSDKTKQISSASEKNASSTLIQGTAPGEFALNISFSQPEIALNVYVTLGDTGIRYHVPRAEFTGKDLGKLSAVLITPFLLASGGRMKVLSESLDWIEVDRYRVPGYVLIPDGSGALIRFRDNSSAFNPYEGDVYGKDYATEGYYSTTLMDDVPVHDPLMPVFGMAQGDRQIGFVAWADSGAEYMDIIVNPDETKSTSYTWAYPRFEYNVKYYQLYDEHGNGFFTTLENLYDYDIDITYCFLYGDGSDGSPSADYVGMAEAYRGHLIDTGVLVEKPETAGDIPIRLDFIMADSENGVILTRQVTVTTTDDVREILEDVRAGGITNINSGLIGWQKKGESLTRPDKDTYSRKTGTKSDFRKLIREFAGEGIDISQARETTTINSVMTGYYRTAVKAVSNWYVSVNKGWLLQASAPVSVFGFATPEKTAAWTAEFAGNVADYSQSVTLSGIANVLNSTWSRSGCETTLTETIRLYEDTLAGIPLKLNLEKPNQYLWKYTDRFLQMPVGNSWYIYESDSVPFLQMVLRGTMEMYAPYANFSFYTQDCILRMIDYNVSPAFILSKEASWNLADTLSSHLYSTEYGLYRDLIRSIYTQINDVLSQVRGYDWIGREAVQDGVIINIYRRGNEECRIIINYTMNDIVIDGMTVPAQSAAAVR